MFRGRISTNAAALMGGAPVTPTVEYLVVAGGVGGNGGSGVVIIRYADTYPLTASSTGSPGVSTAGGYNVYAWTSSGTVAF